MSEEYEILIDFIQIILIMVGWIIVFWLGLCQQKKQLKSNLNMKIYEELYQIKKEFDKSCIDLGLSLGKFSLPFLEMKQCKTNLKSLEKWRDHSSLLTENIYNFSQIYIKLWNHSDMWIAVFPKLKKAKKELFEVQLNDLTKKLHDYNNFLTKKQIEQFNWKLWKKEEIEEKADEISKLFDKIACGYVDDYLTLIHNELITPVIGYKKILRENFANMDKQEKYSILTKDGVKEKINKKYKNE